MTYRVGIVNEASADPTEIRFTNSGRESAVAIVLVSTAVDAGNTPTTTLRKGLVLGKVTASGKYKEYDPNAVDGSQVAKLILADKVDMLDETATAVDTEGVAVFRGDFIAANLPGLDAAAKTALKHCAFDTEI